MGPYRPYGPHSAFKIIVQAPCGFLMGSQNPYGSFMGRFDVLAYICSKPRIASARVHMTSTCTCPFWKHRGHACVIEIRCLKQREKPVKACVQAHMTARRRWMISYGIPKGHRPVRLPKSYGPGITSRFQVNKALCLDHCACASDNNELL